jgi:hypothetical protein
MTKGEVIDIRTGKRLRSTDSMTRDFLYYVLQMQRGGQKFYAVAGPVRAREIRKCIDSLKDMGVKVRRDKTCKPDIILLLEGDPE